MTEGFDRPCHSVLVVEDDAAIRASLTELLELEGYQVFAAENGQEALVLLPNLPTPCLILLDLMMPVMNGWQFAEAVKTDARLAPIPIVVVTAFSSRADDVPAEAVIRKPVDVDLLLEMVARLCNRQAPHPPLPRSAS